MADPWKNASGDAQAYGRRGTVVTPSDTTDLPNVAKAVVVCAAGNLAVIPADNADAGVITFTACPLGFMPPFQVRRVMATGTTATVATVDG